MIKTADGKFLAGSLPPRTVFSYGGVNWVALGYKDASMLCLAEKVCSDEAFDNDNCNNWAKSSLRKYLNDEFLKWLIKGGAEKSDFLPMVTDLTTYVGTKGYGKCEDSISLISLKQHYKYHKRGVIPKVEKYWWTCTAYDEDPDCHLLVDVMPCGSTDCDNDLSVCYAGIRPLCRLRAHTLVTIIEEEKEEK